MKKTVLVSIVFGLVVLFAFAVLSCTSGKDDAKTLVKKAVAYVKYQGKEKAIAEISKPRGMFDKGELYVFAYDLQGVMVAHPKNPTLIGKNLIDIPDSEGKLFRKEIVEKAKIKGSGWVDYKYLNPETKEYEHKTTYFQKEGDLIICCGAYKEYSHEGD
ncbi:MAG: cache domain-containing protein [Syntrophales bacterium]